jgi:hypothetical protein
VKIAMRPKTAIRKENLKKISHVHVKWVTQDPLVKITSVTITVPLPMKNVPVLETSPETLAKNAKLVSNPMNAMNALPTKSEKIATLIVWTLTVTLKNQNVSVLETSTEIVIKNVWPMITNNSTKPKTLVSV